MAKYSTMNFHGDYSPPSSLSRARHQQQWRKEKGSENGGSGRETFMKREKNVCFSNYPVRVKEDDDHEQKNVYQTYGAKFSNPVRNRRVLDDKTINMINSYEHNLEMGKVFPGSKGGVRDEIEQRKKMTLLSKGNYYKENSVGYFKEEYDDDKVMEEIKSKRRVLEEFRKMYRRIETVKVPKQSVRTDTLAWKEMERVYGMVLKPVQTIGGVAGVEVGEAFDLRFELMIMGIHFQTINGIDYMDMYPDRGLLATSVVATDGYEDNTIEPDVVMYTGEGGGSFEGKGKSGKKAKDQVLTKGNLALRNSWRARNDVRVVRGVRRGRNNRPVFVYDGLYKVVDCFRVTGPCGNKQFRFKLVRCPGQNHIVWAKYKVKN